jgi:putative copper resistance protein D
LNGPLVIVRAIHFAATLLLAGTIMFRLFVAVPAFRTAPGGMLQDRVRIRLTWIIWTAFIITALSGAAWLVFLASDIGGSPVADVLSKGIAWIVLTETRFGIDWIARLTMASLLAIFLLQPMRTPAFTSATSAVSAVLASGLLASLAWAGHAAATPGLTGTFHIASDALHLVAAGAWIGGLWPFAILLRNARRAGDPASVAVANVATRRFSILGMMSVTAILATGAINAYALLGTLAIPVRTAYGRLLLVKIGLFIAMVGIASFNRLRLAPRLSSQCTGMSSVQQLERNSLAEAGLGILILAIVAVLGRIPPDLHDHAGHH